MRLPSIWLAAATILAAGCMQEELVTPQGVKPDQIVTVKKSTPDDLEIRPPKATTCLAAAKCIEQTGDDAQLPQQRQAAYEKAVLAYEQAIETDPNCREARLRLARLHEKMENFALAIQAYQEGLQADPNDAVLWYEMGMCYGRQRKWDASIDCLRKAAELQPKNTTYQNHYGWALARGGHLEEAFEQFRSLAGEARAHYKIALMARHLGRDDICRVHLQAALEADPHFDEARKLQQQVDPEKVVYVVGPTKQ